MSSAWLAPAKINLFLQITDKRSDGYHLLKTGLRLIDLADTLSFSKRHDNQIILHCSTPSIENNDNLCFKAAQLLKKHSPIAINQGIDIYLDKKIPMGGGLGGGSSDAATTLLALNEIWQCRLGKQDLLSLAEKLGADVPFFIFGQSALATGIGEKLTPMKTEPTWYIITKPNEHADTKTVFSRVRPKHFSQQKTLPTDVSEITGNNDLETISCDIYPDIHAHLSWLRGHSTCPVGMTGSGCCCFVQLPTKQAAQILFNQLPADFEKLICQGLQTHPHVLGHDF